MEELLSLFLVPSIPRVYYEICWNPTHKCFSVTRLDDDFGRGVTDKAYSIEEVGRKVPKGHEKDWIPVLERKLKEQTTKEI